MPEKEITYSEFVADKILKDPETKEKWGDMIDNHRPELVLDIISIMNNDEMQMSYVFDVAEPLDLQTGNETFDERSALIIINLVSAGLNK